MKNCPSHDEYKLMTAILAFIVNFVTLFILFLELAFFSRAS